MQASCLCPDLGGDSRASARRDADHLLGELAAACVLWMARHVRGQDVNAQACIRILGQLALAELRRLSYGFCCECGSTSQASRLQFSRIAAALRICAPSAVHRDEA